jgi:hypothetical protein
MLLAAAHVASDAAIYATSCAPALLASASFAASSRHALPAVVRGLGVDRRGDRRLLLGRDVGRGPVVAAAQEMGT